MTAYILIISCIVWFIIGCIIFTIFEVNKYGTATHWKVLLMALLAGGPIFCLALSSSLVVDKICELNIEDAKEKLNDWLEK